ncbi:putative adipose-regulatory protein-domain-containing protein [Jimgerdemannia flammicorona]|uniref:Putative adipose-regulatory protein-domain-containing protein n=1 Tax=Jimgerdemannia flammicorona TaxID=994334 RepID=A0A433QEN5_9FUNG|nr:putative adipose-regulatory protein-domain-containing protein [Jimgerdemannia flammicorona]
MWFQYSTEAIPTAHVDLTQHGRYNQPLRHEQSYLVSVELEVPTSQKNLDIGNFMVSVRLQSAANETIQFSSRPTILKYQSPLTRVLYTLWRAIPLVLDISQESQRLRVTLIEGFYEIESNPITQAVVTLSDPRVQVYNAKLRLDADFRGIRYFMYYWPISSTVFFISIFLFWEFAFGVFAWRLFGRAWWAALGPVDSELPSMSAHLEGDGYDDEDTADDDLWQTRNGFETDSDVDSIPRPGQPSAGTEALASLTTAYRQQQLRHQQIQQQQQQQRQLALHRQFLQQQQALLQQQQVVRGPQNPSAASIAASYSSISNPSTSRPATSTAATSVSAAPAAGRDIRRPTGPATSGAGSAARTVSITPSDDSIDSEFTENTASEYEEEEVDGEGYEDQEVPPTPSTVDNLTTTEEYTESESEGDRVVAGQSTARSGGGPTNVTRRAGGRGGESA